MRRASGQREKAWWLAKDPRWDRKLGPGWGVAFGRRRALLLELKEKIGTYRCLGHKGGISPFVCKVRKESFGTSGTLLDAVRRAQDLRLCWQSAWYVWFGIHPFLSPKGMREFLCLPFPRLFFSLFIEGFPEASASLSMWYAMDHQNN